MLVSDVAVEVMSKHLKIELVFEYDELKEFIDTLIVELHNIECTSLISNRYSDDFVLVLQSSFNPEVKLSSINDELIVTTRQLDIIGIGILE